MIEALKRLLERSPAAHGLVRRGVLWGRLILRQPHDADYAAFVSAPPRGGTFVDVGANIGQSAMSIGALRPDLAIVSFEPNPACADSLAWVRRRLGPRFSFHLVALGSAPGRAALTIPRRSAVQLTQEATLRPEVLHEPVTRLRVGRIEDFDTVEVEIRRLDDMDLRSVAAIKIDAQGFEVEVLRGATRVLTDQRPWVMVERSEADVDVGALLAPLGYRPYRVVGGSARLEAVDLGTGPTSFLNLLFVPSDS